jgi:GxxExxY protein
MNESLDAVTGQIIRAAIEVHRTLGPGLLESAYDTCLAFELVQRGLTISRQKPVPLVYGESILGVGYRLDLLVEQSVIVEVKAVEKFAPVHSAQLLSYLRLTKLQVGLLFNFNVKRLTQGGLKRVVNGFVE